MENVTYTTDSMDGVTLPSVDHNDLEEFLHTTIGTAVIISIVVLALLVLVSIHLLLLPFPHITDSYSFPLLDLWKGSSVMGRSIKVQN